MTVLALLWDSLHHPGMACIVSSACRCALQGDEQLVRKVIDKVQLGSNTDVQLHWHLSLLVKLGQDSSLRTA